MKKFILIFVLVFGLVSKGQATGVQAQGIESESEAGTGKKTTFWNNWFVQMGLDMTLQNPYGYNWSGVFPNGKSFGVDVAAGKWFTPAVGYRGKVNWENGIGLFRNDHANWLAPFNQPGVNMDKGATGRSIVICC